MASVEPLYITSINDVFRIILGSQIPLCTNSVQNSQDLCLSCLGGWNSERIDSEMADRSDAAALLNCIQNTTCSERETLG